MLFVGGAYEANSVPTLNLGYEVEEKKARRTLIRQLFPKKRKIKENSDVDDEDDVVPLPISTTVTESQPAVTCSTSYNWPADEMKALKIEHNILKDKIKASSDQLKS